MLHIALLRLQVDFESEREMRSHFHAHDAPPYMVRKFVTMRRLHAEMRSHDCALFRVNIRLLPGNLSALHMLKEISWPAQSELIS